jgi:hypothetical protein
MILSNGCASHEHLACQHVAISPSLDGETNHLLKKMGSCDSKNECIGEVANILRETRGRIFQSNKITELTDKVDGHHGVPLDYEPYSVAWIGRFVNRWKNDGNDDEFRRLIDTVRGTAESTQITSHGVFSRG